MTPGGPPQTLKAPVSVNPAFGKLLNELRLNLQDFSDTLTLSCFVHTDSTRQGPAYSKGKIK